MNELEKQSRDKTGHVEAIRQYMLGSDHVVLSDAQMRIYERVKTAWSMLVKGDNRDEIEAIISEMYEVTNITATRDIQSAIKLFGEINKADKEGMRHLIYLKAEKAYKMAENDKDVKGMNAAIANMIKIKGLETEDPDMPDFAKLEQHNYIIIIPEDQRANLEKMLRAPGTIDLNRIQDAEYEELAG
jgi:hypothetical protein